MDGFNLRCNNLRCRRILDVRAVVTTCSHVFCEHCAENLQLTNPPPGRSRQCPACQASLTAPDDAVITNLSPSEDYRTSLLSGLAPSVIMEICQRGLAFWNYQVTQEVVYQETIAKGLTDKCIALSNDLDKVINDANMEIARLQEKVATLKLSEDDLKKKNHELMENWREKGRKLAQTQELYDKLKRRTLMTQVGQGAVENLERAFGPQQPIHDLSGEEMGGFNAPRSHQQSVRRHKNVDSRPDFMMKGAQVGNINGSRHGRERTGSSSSNGSSNAPPRFVQPPTPNIYAQQQHGYPDTDYTLWSE
ncbi:Similar to E3 ubiquitin-protein ligase CCNB1IP1; acc. no. Q9NPC3 [Pyronema omphalodes CBS 100304]|uniref:Similar to E3 ubiquitin-protein ligase CCNB1IP1 acc. no. Q9NPC3 n=1 Tax=Pyronema omphalodes (strain CBS 100304) TaxID=1076935 RepID=U4L4U5_PYROM|nr:Similar to E3 ubiquitin-protein ligase CCNB1IP1; acc. no. Q9NPC3 [Pyronema omphalodes CBS 100304]